MAKRPVSTYEKGLDRLYAGILIETSRAVTEIAQDVAGIASTRRAPVKTGNLRANIDPEVQIKVDRIKGVISKNVIAATSYAFAQHENTGYKHPKGGEAKYLTATIAEKAEIYAKRIADGVERALKNAKPR